MDIQTQTAGERPVNKDTFVPFQGGQASSWSLFREAAPYLSDEWGVFSTEDMKQYLVNKGVNQSTASATVFLWSDPTERLGFRRFRRSGPRRQGVSTPSEPVVRNELAGETKAGIPPRRAASGEPPKVVAVGERARHSFTEEDRAKAMEVRRSRKGTGKRKVGEAADRAYFHAWAKSMDLDGRTSYSRWAKHMGEGRSFMWRKRNERFAVSAGGRLDGFYLNEIGLDRLREYEPEAYEKLMEFQRKSAAPEAVNTEAVNDRREQEKPTVAYTTETPRHGHQPSNQPQTKLGEMLAQRLAAKQPQEATLSEGDRELIRSLIHALQEHGQLLAKNTEASNVLHRDVAALLG